MRLALLALLVAGCGENTFPITLRPAPVGCALAGPVERVVVTAEGDLAPDPSLVLALPASGKKMSLPKLTKFVHLITVEGLGPGGARVGLGRTAPFDLTTLGDVALPIAYAGPDAACDVGRLQRARWGHRAVLLSDGNLLVIGGRDADGPIPSIELYSPRTAAFSSVGTIDPGSAIGGSATVLFDDSVLVAGGARGDGEAGAVARRASLLARTGLGTGSLRAPRAFHAAARLPTGDVLVSGGCSRVEKERCAPGTLLATGEIWDAATGEWRAGPALSRPRAHHALIERGDGTWLAAGGVVDGGEAGDAEVIDLTGGASVVTVAGGVAAAVDAGGVLAVGGESAASTRVDLTPALAERPVAVGKLATARARATVTRYDDGDVLVVGGVDGKGAPVGAVELIEAAGNVRTLDDAPPRSDHTATLLADGSVIVVGGRDEAGAPRADAHLRVHTARSPWSNVPAETFDGPLRLAPRRPDRARVEGGRLLLTAPARGDGGGPGEWALIPSVAPLAGEVMVKAARGVMGAGVAVIVAWRSEADWLYVTFEPGRAVELYRVGAGGVGPVAGCTGDALDGALLPEGEPSAALRVDHDGGTLRARAGDRRFLQCVVPGGVPPGLVGVATLQGEALFDDLTVIRKQ